jgi:hypothetical protein
VSINQQLVQVAWKATPLKTTVRPMARAIRDSLWAPWNWTRSARASWILVRDFGHLRSVAAGASIDNDGQPVPWFTYPAIEFLGRLDLSDKTVFEYGCGNSTRYWARRAKAVVSVEHVPGFHALIAPQLPRNCELTLRSPAAVYINALAESNRQQGGGGFDIIVIDGHSRVRCAEHAADHLAPGGMIILDNSDWFPEAAAHLRRAGLIEASYSGFAPINDCTSTTSFFFHRAFDFPLVADHARSIGSVPKPKFVRVP